MAEANSAKAAKSSGEAVTKPAKSISDVARRGETAAEPSSRSLLITNRPIMKDPMVVPETETPKEDMAGVGLAKNAAKPKLELSVTPTPKTNTEAKPKAEAAKPKESSEEETAAKAEEEPTKDADEGKPVNAKVVDDEAEAAKQAEHDAAIQKLADSKQYYLPINALEKRRSKQFVMIGVILSLLLIAAWADIALDAGLIHISKIKPVTHFFSN